MKQQRYNRIVSGLLAAVLFIQLALPARAVEEPMDALSQAETLTETEETSPEHPPETTISETEETIPEQPPETTVSETEETIPEQPPETTVSETEETIPEQPPETTIAETEEGAEDLLDASAAPVLLETGGAQGRTEEEIWQIISDNGGAQKPYAFGPGITYGETDSMELLEDWLNVYYTSTIENIVWNADQPGSLSQLPLDDPRQLILLSVTKPEVYQDASIVEGNMRGSDVDLAEVNVRGMTFRGLGWENTPFRGSLYAGASNFILKHALFNNLEYSNQSFPTSVTVTWTGTGPAVAEKLQAISPFELAVTINDGSTAGPIFGQISGEVTASVAFQSSSFTMKTTGNLGMVANTVSDGSLTLKSIAFPQSINLYTEDGNAGLFVGQLKNAHFTLTADSTVVPAGTVIQAKAGATGGLIGSITADSLAEESPPHITNLTFNGTANLSNISLAGKYSGGIAGEAKNINVSFRSECSVTLPKVVGAKENTVSVDSTSAGGLFGRYTIDTNSDSVFRSYDGTGFIFPTEGLIIGVGSNGGQTGGLVGQLELNAGNFTVTAPSVECTAKLDGGQASVGVLVGSLTGERANTLEVSGITTSISVTSNTKPQYLGGVAGKVTGASVRANNVTVKNVDPTVTDKFGGLVGYLGANCTLNTGDTITVSTTANIANGGGIVGEVCSGSVVRLDGITDLSGVSYNTTAGQLVGKQESALIFATGSGNGGNWTYHRSTAAEKVDDIGNYGQVIRLVGKLSPDLITIGADNFPLFKAPSSGYGTISSADDFALHAITFASSNAFGIYNDTDFSATKDITMTGNVDLSGTGIQGLTRDNGSGLAFDGSTIGGIAFDGGGCTLTINTGEIYGLRDNTNLDGKGQCYRHGYYGLLGKVNSAIVKNLKIKTEMNIGVETTTYAGAVFGYVLGGSAAVEGSANNTIEGVRLLSGSRITVSSSNQEGSIGGMIGFVTGDQTGIVVRDCQSDADIQFTANSDRVSLGGILGRSKYKTKIDITFQNVTMGGSITNNTTGNARVGGLAADILPDGSGNREAGRAVMTLQEITIHTNITTSANSSGSSGGFLGYYWDNVNVTFQAGKEEADPNAVTVKKADTQENNVSLTTSGSAVGGLCYAATGKWDMKGKAVALENVTITNGTGDLGLMVCHGERQGDIPGSYSSANAMALYLVMDTAWDTAYSISNVPVPTDSGVFDEIVAYTAAQRDIMRNDAGIISLRTKGNASVNMTTGDDQVNNTYENQTKGKSNNPYSRYYYNLDKMTLTSDDEVVNSPEELLLWSVYKYCANNIRGYLPAQVTSNSIQGNLDMKGYSYYPVTLTNTEVTISGATITFYNREIESLEADNKSTLASAATKRTQHFAMHSGLFYDFKADDTSSASALLTVDSLTLLGTVGMVGEGSGALICGTVGGSAAKSVELKLKNLMLDDAGDKSLVVDKVDERTTYAPLLIHSVDSYSKLSLETVTALNDTTGATSLIGWVGNEKFTSTGINLVFRDMRLMDKAGRFTKASMLDQFRHNSTTNTAVYNFTKDEDWDTTKETPDHIHNVTYGKEIGGTVEYAASENNLGQRLYAQSTDQYVSHSGDNFDGSTYDDFSGYLHYVREGYKKDQYHEIQVNSTLKDVDGGCGTYGDPYVVTGAELQAIAGYLMGGSASPDWKLNLPAHGATGESTLCTEGTVTHSTYTFQYGSGDWEYGNVTLTETSVREYLRNAYYVIEKDITLSSFQGLGSQQNPFRGVVVGKKKADGQYPTVTLEGTLPDGFINFSYGSVVKDLKLAIQGEKSISFTQPADGIDANYTMKKVFGGVIGNILGGDNIIENVGVKYTGTPVTLSGKDYLVPVGGYVGLIQGGGVIFRGTNTLTGQPSDFVTNDKYFYVNRYVGRVLQGFAVNEGDPLAGSEQDKNYPVCDITEGDTNGITLSDKEITLFDARALLIFSSVTNSGGAGGGSLKSYLTTARSYWDDKNEFVSAAVGGKVRNASYKYVGSIPANTSENYQEAKGDYDKSLTDDFTKFGSENTSYLDTHYAGGKLYNACHATEAYSLKLTGDLYDMSGYGNGYRSIGPRYLSTAVCKQDGTVDYKLVNPLISGVTAKDENAHARIYPKVTVGEYVNDEFHAFALGGLFNTIRLTKNETTFQNITIGGVDNTDNQAALELEYWEYSENSENSSKVWVDATHKIWGELVQGFTNLNYGQGRGMIAVGGFAGNTSMEVSNTSVKFDAINTQYLHIKAPFDAGGILGHTGIRVGKDEFSLSETEQKYRICLLSNNEDKETVPSFHNCTFQSLYIDGGWHVGGYIGVTASGIFAPTKEAKSANYATNITFDETRWLGKDASIVCRRPKNDKGIDSAKYPNGTTPWNCLPAAGGLIGCSRYKINININNTGRARIENVEVRSSRSAGGIVAWPFNTVTIKNVDIVGNPTTPNQVGDLTAYNPDDTSSVKTDTLCEFSGGMVGYAQSSAVLTVENCSVSNLRIVASLRTGYPCYAGGIAGNINAGGDHKILNCSVQNLKLANNMCKDSDKQPGYAGGFVARLQNGTLYGANLLADSIECAVEPKKTNYHGNLLGGVDVSSSVGKNFYLDGVSIQNTKNVTIPSVAVSYIPSNSTYYIAYADYTGAAQVETRNDGKTELLQGTESQISTAAKPYITTSPRGTKIDFWDGRQKTGMYLYGDGGNPELVFGIFEDILTDDTEKVPGKFYYSNPKYLKGQTSELVERDYLEVLKQYASSFREEMGLSEDSPISDFSVLQVPVATDEAVTKEIQTYLNLITNNAYDRVRYQLIKPDWAKAEIVVYKWNDEQTAFEKVNETPALSTLANGGFSTNGYDSGKNQFELLTLTFKQSGKEYKVQVPIVVRRMLEIDFTATLKDSPSFREDAYETYNSDGYKPSLLTGYGSTVSALLQYRFNSSLGVQQDYNWQYHLDSGLCLDDPGLTIRFRNDNAGMRCLPEGTQLTLLDCADNNRAYTYTVLNPTADDKANGSNILLTDFADSNGNPYSRWLSEIIGASAEAEAGGGWVQCAEEETPTARVNGIGYRKLKSGEALGDRTEYRLKTQEATPEAKFYLVIHIPEESMPENTDGSRNLNGSISTSLQSLTGKIAYNINKVRTNNQGKTVRDPGTNSESCYNFLFGYLQELSDKSTDGDALGYCVLRTPEADGNYVLHMDLVDEITSAKKQKDTEAMPLYYRSEISLPMYVGTGDTQRITPNGFPTGCFGTATIRVYLMDELGNKTYYHPQGTEMVKVTGQEQPLTIDWVSDRTNMVLELKNESGQFISLAKVREDAKAQTAVNGKVKFYVETSMDIHMSVTAAEAGIAGALSAGNTYTSLSYVTYLGSDSKNLASTNYVASKLGDVRYYQERSSNSTLTHTANDPTQLGINCSDLTSANGVIFTTGVYDLSAIYDLDALIAKADGVLYTLSLWQRQENGDYDQVMSELPKYLRSVGMNGHEIQPDSNGNYQWVDAGKVTRDEKRFVLPIRVQVNTDVETNGTTFANYQLRLTAQLQQGDVVLDQPLNKEEPEEIRYDYVTYTITRILTSGYWKSTS